MLQKSKPKVILGTFHNSFSRELCVNSFKNIFKYRQNVLAKLSYYSDCKQKRLNWYLSCISGAISVGTF